MTAQPQAIQQDTLKRPVAAAARRSAPITIDGRLDDAGWATARPDDRFTQQQPNEGAAPTERTEFRVLYDDDAIYIGARMYDSRGAAGVTRQLTRRDQEPESDLLRIDFDTYHDRLRSVQFNINPSGSRGDAADNDGSWDPVWESGAHVDSLGWSAEIRIPFSQLRFSTDSVQTWGMNVTRFVHRTQELSQWAFWRQKDVGGPSFFGELTQLRIVRAPAHAELLPYVLARTQRLNTSDPESPFHDPSPSDFRVGGDLKYLLSSNFTLSATVNPDFGQVEVDPAVVNLSAYETFFSERRPFFIEGGDVFSFGQPGCNINCGFGLALFYSRRIGRNPQGAELAYNAGDFVDLPDNTAILGAAKITGRTSNGFSLGILDAVTRKEVADVATPCGEIITQVVEPLTNNFVARAKQELMGGNLIVGGILTSVNRKTDEPSLAALLASSAQSAGADVQYYWDKHTYSFYAAVSGTRVSGDSLAIGTVQRSSARYFQRPDRSEYLYDPLATSLSGVGAIARLSKESGAYTGDLNVAINSPGFEFNDLGYFTTADWRWVNGTFGRQFTTPTKYYRKLSMTAGTQFNWNLDGDNTGHDLTLVGEYQFLNYWEVSAVINHSVKQYNDRLTRGGPVVAQPKRTFSQYAISSDPRPRLTFSASYGHLGIADGTGYDQFSVDAVFKPAANIRLSAGPGYTRDIVNDQYVTSVDDPTATAFFGKRYVFAHIEQRQVYMSTRANITFTPRLSFELFAQPLIASGAYSDFREFAAPRQDRMLTYGKDIGTITSTGTGSQLEYLIDPDADGPAQAFTVSNPDFNFRSLRGTAVLRWEWRPGSTAFLVWSQTRSGTESVGDLQFSRDRRALFEAPADNIFALKVSYWLGI